ncbi:hypothetical protein A3K86_18270 [Photobacterium jeanii]|uniref:Porin n=1 Tax=Photobacterium jeanii TaxID=858640 RepID=A0A178K0T7_9GAMM|nr:hypothetical protein [Photobacterium jeanii]OAN10930.1 hypothetical protein A3K86_18270 [Photobacterium jeanii]PST90446.1 hypothetical protein C9I91_07370 [Photobacterium jeanii]
MKPAIFPLLAVAALPVHAEEHQPDPADLTQTNTFIWAQAGNKDYTVTGGIAGSLTSKFNYLGLFEHSRSWKRDTGNANDSTRARLFGTQDVNWGAISKVGASVDYIKGHNDTPLDTLAVGAIAKVETGLDWLALYPNLAYVELSARDSQIKNKSKGYQANLFASIYLDESGQYLMLQPQYTSTEYIDVKKMEVSYGLPLSESGKLWADIKLGYTRTSGKKALSKAAFDSDKQVKAGVSYYF